jgi:hypothetical protein
VAVEFLGSVEEAAATKQLSETVRRTDRIDGAETGGIAVVAADPALASMLGIARPGVKVWLRQRWFGLGAVALLVGGVGLCPGGDWPPPLSHSS